jgi:hypothetical protein
MDSSVADKTQLDRIGTTPAETPQNGSCNGADTPEPLPTMTCGAVADVAAQQINTLDDFKQHASCNAELLAAVTSDWDASEL